MIIIFLLFVFAILSIFISNSYMIFAYLVAIIIISICAIMFEKKKISAENMVILSSLTAFAVVGRMIFTPIPNGQPATFIVIMSGIVFGPFYGTIVGSLVAPISNVFMGQGPWTIWQMLAWGIVGNLSGVLFYKFKIKNMVFKIIYAFLCGFLFDYIMNIWHLIAYVKEFSYVQIIATLASGFYFDLNHSVFNALFMAIFGMHFERTLNRMKNKLRKNV